MKHNIYHLNEKRPDAKGLIAPDLPFDYEEMVSITGSDYVRDLHHHGSVLRPYDELKRNVSDLYFRKEEAAWMMAV